MCGPDQAEISPNTPEMDPPRPTVAIRRSSVRWRRYVEVAVRRWEPGGFLPSPRSTARKF